VGTARTEKPHRTHQFLCTMFRPFQRHFSLPGRICLFVPHPNAAILILLLPIILAQPLFDHLTDAVLPKP
jgi:hypothetical protein